VRLAGAAARGGGLFSLIAALVGTLVVEPLRRRQLRALVARPPIGEKVMRKIEVKLLVKFDKDVTLEGFAEILRRMKVEAMKAGASEVVVDQRVGDVVVDLVRS
jgi:hypothetical protein